MQQEIHCITLRVVKHNDTSSIVTVWSRERGRLALVVPAGASKQARRSRALMMPFSLFEGMATIREGSDLARIADVRPYMGGNVSAIDPMKNIIAMFLADFLYAVLRESQPDELMSDFIFQSVGELGEAKGTALANFHLLFLFRLGHFLGISPDMGTYKPGRCFDLREGLFTATAPLHRNFLVPDKAQVLYLLSRANTRSLGFIKFSREQRNEILDAMLEYYTLHHSQVTQLPAVQIVRGVLG